MANLLRALDGAEVRRAIGSSMSGSTELEDVEFHSLLEATACLLKPTAAERLATCAKDNIAAFL